MIRERPVPPDVRQRLQTLAEHFRRDRRVAAVYLFGSFARGDEGPLSDVDIAFLLEPDTPRRQLQQLTLEYLDDVNRLLGTDEVSFLLLDDAPLTFRSQVVRTGEVLVDNDPRARVAFEAHTEKLFLDFKPSLDAYDDALLDSLGSTSK